MSERSDHIKAWDSRGFWSCEHCLFRGTHDAKGWHFCLRHAPKPGDFEVLRSNQWPIVELYNKCGDFEGK
jgi:hypothetical protein